MSIATPSIQPIHDWRMRLEHVAHVLAPRRRREPHQPSTSGSGRIAM